jgi:hypothetical protein
MRYDDWSPEPIEARAGWGGRQVQDDRALPQPGRARLHIKLSASGASTASAAVMGRCLLTSR